MLLLFFILERKLEHGKRYIKYQKRHALPSVKLSFYKCR